MNTQTAQKGQSLVEVLIVLAVTAVVILALVVASLMGLKNAQFAQNQSKATKHAQETIDIIKSIRDRDQEGTVNFRYSVSLFVGQVMTTNITKFSALYTVPMSSSTSCSDRYCYFTLLNNELLLTISPPDSLFVDIGEGFSRKITFEDDTPLDLTKEKRVTAQVRWSDGSGYHESKVQTILTNH